jgi:hypothetical protein
MYKTNSIPAAAVDGTTGTPLGGFGAGAVKFCAHNGTFASMTQPPADQNDYQSMGDTRLQFYSSRDGQIEIIDTMKAALSDGRYADDAIWPEHRVHFGTINGIQVDMKAFSPLDRSDYVIMSMPYAFYELTLTNYGASNAEAACAFLLDIQLEEVVWIEGKGFASRQWSVYAQSNDPDAVISAGNDQGFFTQGQCHKAPSGTLNKTAVRVKLAPNETQKIMFVLAWYDDTDSERSFYLGKYDHSAAIADLGLTHFDDLRINADELVIRMRGSNLPDWLKNQSLNTLANLSNNSMFKRDGRVAFAEGQWTCFGTMDQMWHARQIVNQLVPYYAWQELHYWARTQKDSGQIHHDFNSSPPDKSRLVDWDDKDHVDYRNTEKWVDLNAGFIISVYETFRATDDREQLAALWPHMKKAVHRMFDQVALYGNPDYPYTFDESENSYDAGGDPNPFNASLSAVAYKIMSILAEGEGESSLRDQCRTAYETIVASFRARYLNGNFPTKRGCESYFAGQWLAMHLKLGQIWSEAETELVLEKLDGYYHPYYWGLGNLNGTYNEWTPYILTHYGGLLLNTRRANQWAAMQKDSYNRQYNNRNYVFNHPLDILPAVTEPNYISTTISGDKQYISLPGIWRNYYDIVGYHRDKHTQEIWIQPILLDEMNHVMKDAMFITPEGYGSISCKESGDCYQNKDILLTMDAPIEVSAIHLTDHYGETAAVMINGEACPFTRCGEGYTKELIVAWKGIIDHHGIHIEASGDAGYVPPSIPKKPAAGSDVVKYSSSTSAYQYIEAESAAETAGITLITPIGGTWYVTDCHNFDYIKIDNVMFEEVGSRAFIAKVSSRVDGSKIEIVLDSVGGEVIGVCPVSNTGGDLVWQVVTCSVKKTTGKHNVILKFYGNSEHNLLNIDKFKFLQADGRLDRTGWKASTSKNKLNAYTIVDGDPDTGWRVSYQAEGAYLLLDMQELKSFDKVTLHMHTNDGIGQYEAFVSTDGIDYGSSIASGTGESNAAVMDITFSTQMARYIKIVLSDVEVIRQVTLYDVNVWSMSIHETE